MRDSDVFALAGLWDRWKGKRESQDSCSIIVMPANDVMKPLHKRIPAIIAPACQDLWLDPRVTDKAELMIYLNSAPSSQLVIYLISPWVNALPSECAMPGALKESPPKGGLISFELFIRLWIQ